MAIGTSNFPKALVGNPKAKKKQSTPPKRKKSKIG